VPVIPGRKNRKVKLIYDKAIYKLRGGIERYCGKLEDNKLFCLRFDKEDQAFLSFVALAAIKIFFNLKIS
jgi:hypothetical protein